MIYVSQHVFQKLLNGHDKFYKKINLNVENNQTPSALIQMSEHNLQ